MTVYVVTVHMALLHNPISLCVDHTGKLRGTPMWKSTTGPFNRKKEMELKTTTKKQADKQSDSSAFSLIYELIC